MNYKLNMMRTLSNINLKPIKLRNVFERNTKTLKCKGNYMTVARLRTELLKNNFDPLNYGYEPTVNQLKYVNSLNDDRISIAIGSPGTGKTMLATGYALENLKNNAYQKIIITRPTVTVDEENGYLPGDIHQKMAPWLAPLYDNFNLFSSRSNVEYLLNNLKIEIVPLSYIRGRTFDNTIIIGDEMQNSTINQMRTLLTRLGENSKCILTGDLNQSDLANKIKEDNGLSDFLNRYYDFTANKCFADNNFINITYLNVDDVKRSEIVKNIIEIYDNK